MPIQFEYQNTNTETYLKTVATIPSVHSNDTGSNCPYNWPIVTALGLMNWNLTLFSLCPCFSIIFKVSAKI